MTETQFNPEEIDATLCKKLNYNLKKKLTSFANMASRKKINDTTNIFGNFVNYKNDEIQVSGGEKEQTVKKQLIINTMQRFLPLENFLANSTSTSNNKDKHSNTDKQNKCVSRFQGVVKLLKSGTEMME